MTETDRIRDLLTPPEANLPAAVAPTPSPRPAPPPPLPDKPQPTQAESPGPSPRLTVAVTVIVVLVLALTTAFFFGRSTKSDPTEQAPIEFPSTTEYVPTTRADTPEEAQRTAADVTARAFINAWLTRGTPDDRRAAMAPYATKQLVDRMVCYGYGPCRDEPESLPPGRLVEAPTLLNVRDNGALYGVQLTDGHTVMLSLSYVDGRWVVGDFSG
jgi:hypothetical protein